MTEYTAWRCCHEKEGENLFCPPEGCPKWSFTADGECKPFGCARDKGWLPGMESPRECRGLLPLKST